MNNSKSGVVECLVKRVLKYDNSKLSDRIESKMNNIHKKLFVIPSLSMGILGDPLKLNIAGDGTCMPTQASPYGKKVCDCKLKPGNVVIVIESLPITVPPRVGIALMNTITMVILITDSLPVIVIADIFPVFKNIAA